MVGSAYLGREQVSGKDTQPDSTKGSEAVIIPRGTRATPPITHLTPHDLRATLITLALEGKAPLQVVQYAARHKDPRMTEHYQRRKVNLDDNAVDYIHY